LDFGLCAFEALPKWSKVSMLLPSPAKTTTPFLAHDLGQVFVALSNADFINSDVFEFTKPKAW